MMRQRNTVIRSMALALAFAAVGDVRIATAQRGSGDATQSAALIGLARTARDQGRYGDAATYFRDASARSTFDTPLLVEYFWVAHRADAQTARQLAERILRATPGDAAVRDGLIGLLVGAKQEAALRTVAQAGQTHDSAAALWPRRIAESHLREGNGAQAAEYFQRASALAGGTSADLAQRALALERTADPVATLKAWDQVGPSAWSSRPE